VRKLEMDRAMRRAQAGESCARDVMRQMEQELSRLRARPAPVTYEVTLVGAKAPVVCKNVSRVEAIGSYMGLADTSGLIVGLFNADSWVHVQVADGGR
jgi:hypothetical protein